MCVCECVRCSRATQLHLLSVIKAHTYLSLRLQIFLWVSALLVAVFSLSLRLSLLPVTTLGRCQFEQKRQQEFYISFPMTFTRVVLQRVINKAVEITIQLRKQCWNPSVTAPVGEMRRATDAAFTRSGISPYDGATIKHSNGPMRE